jgi:hypothetical protein
MFQAADEEVQSNKIIRRGTGGRCNHHNKVVRGKVLKWHQSR